MRSEMRSEEKRCDEKNERKCRRIAAETKSTRRLRVEMWKNQEGGDRGERESEGGWEKKRGWGYIKIAGSAS
jgi:hypothetical protein